METLESFLEDYEQHAKKRADLETALLGVKLSQSAIVQKIGTLLAPAKKFQHRGHEVTIVSRGETYFFRGFDDKEEK